MIVFSSLKQYNKMFLSVIGLLILGLTTSVNAEGLADTVAEIKPSIVGVGTYLPTRRPQSQLHGTGFVVSDGYHVITNAHVVNIKMAIEKKEKLVIFAGTGKSVSQRDARILLVDEEHDLALLRITGTKLPALVMADSKQVREGNAYAFTGFPIGAVLGLYPVTHRGIVSSITPVATPVPSSGQLTADLIKRLRDTYNVFQLDATAYPGNSGSPLYEETTGKVVGVLNSVFIKTTKEAVIEKPSGISYAIPSQYVKALIDKVKGH